MVAPKLTEQFASNVSNYNFWEAFNKRKVWEASKIYNIGLSLNEAVTKYFPQDDPRSIAITTGGDETKLWHLYPSSSIVLKKRKLSPLESVHHFDTEIPHKPLKLKPADIRVTTERALSPPQSSIVVEEIQRKLIALDIIILWSNELLRARTLDGVE